MSLSDELRRKLREQAESDWERNSREQVRSALAKVETRLPRSGDTRIRVQIDARQLVKLDTVAEILGRSRASLMREAIDRLFEHYAN